VILIEADTGGFLFQALANSREQGAELLTAAWEEHCKEYPDSLSAPDHDGVRITDLSCGVVLRNGEKLYFDPNMTQAVEVAVLTNPGGVSVYMGDPGSGVVKENLLSYMNENWDSERSDDIEDIPEEDRMETFFDDGPSYLSLWPDVDWIRPR
jgi:hypothetical protein